MTGGVIARASSCALILLAVCLACSSTLNMQEPRDDPDYERINRNFAYSIAQVTTCDGDVYKRVRLLCVRADSVICADAGFGGSSSLPTGEVAEITLHARGEGTLKGLYWGTAISFGMFFNSWDLMVFGPLAILVGSVGGAMMHTKTVVLNEGVCRTLRAYRRADPKVKQKIDGIVRETDLLIRVVWRGRELWLPKRAVIISEEDGELWVTMSKNLYEDRLVGAD